MRYYDLEARKKGHCLGRREYRAMDLENAIRMAKSCWPKADEVKPIGDRADEVDEIDFESLEAADALMSRLESGRLQCGCEKTSCTHFYLGDEPGAYPRDRS